MKRSAYSLGGLALALLFALPTSGRADLIAWSYNWSRSPSEIHADAPGTGKITLTDESQHNAVGDSDVVATNIRTFQRCAADQAGPLHQRGVQPDADAEGSGVRPDGVDDVHRRDQRRAGGAVLAADEHVHRPGDAVDPAGRTPLHRVEHDVHAAGHPRRGERGQRQRRTRRSRWNTSRSRAVAALGGGRDDPDGRPALPPPPPRPQRARAGIAALATEVKRMTGRPGDKVTEGRQRVCLPSPCRLCHLRHRQLRQVTPQLGQSSGGSGAKPARTTASLRTAGFLQQVITVVPLAQLVHHGQVDLAEVVRPAGVEPPEALDEFGQRRRSFRGDRVGSGGRRSFGPAVREATPGRATDRRRPATGTAPTTPARRAGRPASAGPCPATPRGPPAPAQ